MQEKIIHVVIFLYSWIPSFFIYQRHKMGLAYCFLNSLHSFIILCSDRLIRTLLLLLPAQHFILQFQKWNLVGFFFFQLMISFSLLRIMSVSLPSVSNLDKIASFIGSDLKHIQECKYVCSWHLGPVFLAGEVWKSAFLDRITLLECVPAGAESSWVTCSHLLSE